MLAIGVTIVMVVMERLGMGLATLTKAAMSKGMSNYVYVVYAHGFGTTFILLPSITGIRYSSPVLASVISDLTPAYTYILAIIYRMEKLDLRVQSSLAMSIGSVLRLCLLLAAGSFAQSLFYVVQTSVIRKYPEEQMVSFIYTMFVTFQSAILALIAERNRNCWKLKPDLGLITIAYSAIFCIAIQGVVHTWACRKMGPVYVSMFKPLSIVIAVVMGITFLGETLHLEVIWGQAEEGKVEKEGINRFKSSSSKAPLLENRVMEA
ncbi:hypothetical protein Patl1_16198 [Pistacia atlantica]|uniref:Uncharacterized protein n=1 Tax=Pistacia atlantica TaxID=434234 RepID=A0ACC1BB01_9ROSI|nr:hypothetical protein Patl1_16198 [Pistacia atlantica]